MHKRKSSRLNVNAETREGNARSGFCATAFFASANEIPAVVSEALPDDAYCSLDDMVQAMRKVEKHLLAMNPNPGKHFVLIKVQDARDLILTLVLADTSVGLDKELDPSPAIAADHQQLRDAVQGIKKIINAAQSGGMSYEAIRHALDKLPNPALTNNVLLLMEQHAPVVQSLAGPIDLSTGKMTVKQVASERPHVVKGRVAGGYDEQSGSIVLEITDIDDADPRLFVRGSRITVRVLGEEHRISLLLAQLAKVLVRATLKVPRIPLMLTTGSKADLRADLQDLVVLEQMDSLEKIKASLIQQLDLDL